MSSSTRPAPAPHRRPDTYPPDAYDEDGVDVTQIREMLALSPAERLDALRGFAKGLLELADAAHPA